MRYVDFRDDIFRELARVPEGLTWRQLQERLGLPYATPCPNWVARLESSGLLRTRGTGRALVWKFAPRRSR